MMRAVRRWCGVDERGSSSVEALLLLPVMMLLATFVLWAGRAGVAALTVDLAAEEAAAAAALHCTEIITHSECEQFVGDILSGHPSLDFLCVGGPRSDLRRESSTGEGVEEGVEPVGVMVVGVRFACDTDGAVAPLRGLFPLVTFHGQSTEVAVSLPAFEIDVGIEDADPVDESQDLRFRVFVVDPLDVPVTLSYDITNVTPFTGGGDYSLDGPLKVTIPALAEEAYIRLSVNDDDLHEDDEQVLIELEPESFVAGRFVQLNFIENRSSASGTILDNDELVVEVSGPASPAVEGVDDFALFTVEVANAGREVAIVHQARELSNHPGPTATGGLDCAANPPPDFVTVGSELSSELIFRPGELTTEYVEVTICNDEVSNEPQEAYAFEWHDSKYRNQFRGQLTGYIGGVSSVFLRVPDAVAAEGETISFELSLVDGVTDEPKKFDFPITIGYSTAELPTTYDHLTNGFATPGAGTGCYTLSGTDYCDRDYGEATVNGRPNPDYDKPRSTPATPGDDYEVQKERFVTFPAQSSTAVIEIPSIDDTLDEHFQRFALRLTAPTEVELPYSSQCANAMPVDSRDDCAVGVIVDNEQIPAVGIAGLSMTVEGRDFEIEVRLVDRFNPWILIPVEKGEISADVWTSDSDVIGGSRAMGGLECVSSGPGPDYIKENTTLVFPVNVATQTLSVKICSDDRAEDVEEFSLTVQGQAGLNGLFERQFKGQITEELDVQILDASQTHVMVNSVGVASEGEPMEFRVQVWPRLERPADPAVEVDTADFPTITVDYHSVPIEPGPDPVFLAAIPGEDYEAAEGTLTFDAFTSDLTISVETIENTDYDPPRALGVVLDNLSQEARMATDRDWNLLLDDDCHLADANPSTPPRMEIVATDGPEGATHDVWVNLMDRLCDPNSSVQDWTYQIRAVPEHPTSSADLDTNLKRGAFPNFNIAFGYNGYGYKVDSSGVFLSKHFPLLITDDDIAEDDEPYYIELEWTSGPYPGYVLRSPTVYIQDDDSDAIVVSVDDVTGIEGQPLKFTVLLSNANSQTVKIGYETSESSSGRAVEGDACSGGIDFIKSRSSIHGVLTFDPGEKTKTVEVQLCGDEDPDEGETFQLKLLPTDDMSGTEIIDRIAQGTILDLDCIDPSNPYHPVPTISASDVTVTEADLSARLQLELSLPFCSKQLDALEHTVTYGTVDQDDLPAELSDGSMWVTDVDANTTEISIELDHIDDGIDDDGETYTLTFKWGAHLYPGSGVVVVEVTVKDNSDGVVATLVQRAPSAVEGQPVVFEVALNRAAVADVEVNYLVGPDSTGTEPATAGVDYTEPVSPLVIRAGARSGSIEVATVPDGVDEQNETFQLTVTTVDGGAVLNADEPSYVVGTIREPCVEPADPAAPVTITAAASPPEWLEDAGTVQYVFELGGLLCRGGLVEFMIGAPGGTASPGTDFVRSSGIARVPALQRQFTLNVVILDDEDLEDAETVAIVVRWAAGSPQTWLDLGDVSAQGIIADDEQDGQEPVVSVGSPVEAVEGAPLEFTVSLDGPSNQTVTVAVATHQMVTGDAAVKGRDYVNWTGLVTFGPGDEQKTVSVRTLDDSEIEGHESLQLRLLASPRPQGATLDPDARIAIGTILDDDCVAVASIGAGDSPPALEFRSHSSAGERLGLGSEGTEVYFEVVPEYRMCETVYIQAEALPVSATASDFTADSALDNIAIPPDGVGRFSVLAVADALSETDETFEVVVHWHPDSMPPHFYDPVGGPVFTTTATIIDASSLPTITATAPVVLEGGTAVFDVSIDAASGRLVSVDYATSDGTAESPADYEHEQGVLRFWPGGDLTEQVMVRTVADFELEDTEDFLLDLSDPVNATLSDDPGSVGEMIVRAEILDLEASRRPTGVNVTAAPRALDVSWTAPASPDGLTGYVVRVEPAPGEIFSAPPQEVRVSDTSTSVRVGDLVADVTYVVVVMAEYQGGHTAPAPPSTGTPTALSTPPGGPQGATFEVHPGARPAAQARPDLPVAVRVSWTAPPPSDGVILTELQWRAEGASYVDANRSALGASPAGVDEFDLGSVYDLRLRHWSVDGPGPWVEGTGLVIAFAPDPPTLVRVDASDASVSPVWVAPAFDGGSAVTAYVVEYREISSDPWSAIEVDAPANTVRVTGLVNGHSYELRVLARNAAGTSLPSRTVTAEPLALPSAPANVAMTGYRDRVLVEWDPPVDGGEGDGEGDIVGYDVEYRTSSTPFILAGPWLDVPVTGTRTVTITGLTLGDSYDVRVRARNNSAADSGEGPGVGPWSVTVSGGPSTEPTEPRALVLRSLDNRMDVSWQAPRYDGESAITGYDVHYRLDAAPPGQWIEVVSNHGTLLISITGLVNGTSYQVRVRARNGSGEDSGSGPGVGEWTVPVTGAPSTLPTEPLNVVLTPFHRQLDAQWHAPASDGESSITAYQVEYGNPTSGFRRFHAAGLSATIRGLRNGESYQVRVRALNGSDEDGGDGRGVGPWSSPVWGTPDASVPSEPLNVRFRYAGHQLIAEWDPPEHDSRATVASYQMEWRGLKEGYDDFYTGACTRGGDFDRRCRRLELTDDSWYWKQIAPGQFIAEYSKTRAHVGGLCCIANYGVYTPHLKTPEYEVRVRAVNVAGPGPWSIPVMGGRSPGPVGGLTAQVTAAPAQAASVLLQWTAPADDGGLPIGRCDPDTVSILCGYSVRWKASSELWGDAQERNVPATETSTLIENLELGQTYDFEVAAINRAGRGGSRELAETPILAPATPSDVRVVAGDSRLTVEWKLSATDAQPVAASILRWRVEGGTDADWTVVTHDGFDRTAQTIGNLSNGTVYEVQLAASNSSGTSDWTAAASGEPLEASDAPQNLHGAGWRDQMRIAWDWTDSEDYPIDGFLIRWRRSTESTFAPADQATLGASARDHAVDLFERHELLQLMLQDNDLNRAYVVEVTALNGVTHLGTATVSAVVNLPGKFLSDEVFPPYDANHPWIRTTFEKIPFGVQFTAGGDMASLNITNTQGYGWFFYNIVEYMDFRRNAWDTLREDPAATDANHALVHEIAHAMTLDRDNMTVPLAVLGLYHLIWIDGDDSCLVHEILAETISVHVVPDAVSDYYRLCDAVGAAPTPEAAAVTASALAGQIPQWFDDRYELAGGSMDMEKLWADLADPDLLAQDPGTQRTLFNEPLALVFQEFFGGVCSDHEAWESFGRLINNNPNDDDRVTANPWIDGGCESHRPTDVSIVSQSDSLEVTWEPPLWTKRPDAGMYSVQWKGPGETYSGERTVLVRNGNTSATIEQLSSNTTYTVRLALVGSGNPGVLYGWDPIKRYVEFEATTGP